MNKTIMNNHVSRSVGIVTDTLRQHHAAHLPMTVEGLASLIDFLEALQPEIEHLEGGKQTSQSPQFTDNGENIVPFPLWRMPRPSAEDIA